METKIQELNARLYEIREEIDLLQSTLKRRSFKSEADIIDTINLYNNIPKMVDYFFNNETHVSEYEKGWLTCFCRYSDSFYFYEDSRGPGAAEIALLEESDFSTFEIDYAIKNLTMNSKTKQLLSDYESKRSATPII